MKLVIMSCSFVEECEMPVQGSSFHWDLIEKQLLHANSFREMFFLLLVKLSIHDQLLYMLWAICLLFCLNGAPGSDKQSQQREMNFVKCNINAFSQCINDVHQSCLTFLHN
jgi:hypothetical protein